MNTTYLANDQRQRVTLNYEMSIMWESKPRTTPHKTSRPLMGPEQVARPKTLQVINDDDDVDDVDDVDDDVYAL
jgi:hypothetical protein